MMHVHENLYNNVPFNFLAQMCGNVHVSNVWYENHRILRVYI